MAEPAVIPSALQKAEKELTHRIGAGKYDPSVTRQSLIGGLHRLTGPVGFQFHAEDTLRVGSRLLQTLSQLGCQQIRSGHRHSDAFQRLVVRGSEVQRSHFPHNDDGRGSNPFLRHPLFHGVKRSAHDALSRQRALFDDRRWRASRLSVLQKPFNDQRKMSQPHEKDQSARKLCELREIERQLSRLRHGMAGHDVKASADGPVRHRNPRRCQRGDRRCDSGYHLKRNAFPGNSHHLFPAASKDEGIAAL